MKSLLSKSLKQFALCAVVCFALTAPLFYLLTKYYYAEDMMDIIEAVNQGQAIPPLDLERDIMAGMMLQFVLIFAVIAIAMLITMRYATAKLWQPFDDTLQKAEQFNLAQSDIPQFAATDIREFARLNNSLGLMMAKNKETYRIQKEFTENASHELQTPLAIIRSKLDLLMQENLGEKEAHIVADLYQLTMRMSHLNRNLLLLAKIDNAQYTTMEDVDVATMLADSLPLYETLQGNATLRLLDQRTSNSVRLRANRTLLECMLKNLIVNAIRHTTGGSNILITVNDGSLSVSNAAADGKPLNHNDMFRRFHSEGATQKGNGLGLAIVKAICDYHQWKVEYNFEGGRHRFVVRFKYV